MILLKVCLFCHFFRFDDES